MDPTRARSFGAVAAAYAEHRPDYPQAALDWALAPALGRHLLDLGAGTGKLTTGLTGRGDVIAVDPDVDMLAELRARLPGVDAREGSAESIPVPAGSVDAVLVGQAWHWFDPERALPEIARVLRPGGVLAAVWNNDDSTVDWVAGYHAAATLDRTVPEVPAAGGIAAFPEHPAFRPSDHATFPNPVPSSIDGLIATLRTHSWALLSDPTGREESLARVRSYLQSHPETSGTGFVLPLVTTVVRATRRFLG